MKLKVQDQTHHPSVPHYHQDTFDDEDLVGGSGDDDGYDDYDNHYLDEIVIDKIEEDENQIKEELSEEETEKRSKFFELHGLDLLSLDMSCMKNFISGKIFYLKLINKEQLNIFKCQLYYNRS